MKKLLAFAISLFSLATPLFFLPSTIHAVCPVCTVAVAAGLGLSRYLGVDDLISGVWIGGLILSTSFWLANWLDQKKFRLLAKIKKNWLTTLTFALTYGVVVLPLWKIEIIGHPFNTIWGIDKLIFGILVGIVFFALGVSLDKEVRKKKGKQLFNYQKVIFPILGLVIGSLLMYLLTKP